VELLAHRKQVVEVADDLVELPGGLAHLFDHHRVDGVAGVGSVVEVDQPEQVGDRGPQVVGGDEGKLFQVPVLGRQFPDEFGLFGFGLLAGIDGPRIHHQPVAKG
jgi:hypothetical protein